MASARHSLIVIIAGSFALLASGARQRAMSNTAASVNPIRKVVNMLENIKRKVEADGEAEEKMYKKFQCYCKGSDGSLEKTIKEAEAKVPQLESEVESLKSQKEGTESKLADNEAAQKDAEQTIVKATTAHEHTHEELQEGIHEDKINIKGLDKALQQTKGAGLLQASDVAGLRRVAATRANVRKEARSTFEAFLDSGRTSTDLGDIGEIEGTLKAIRSDIKKDKQHLREEDKEDTVETEDLTSAKKKEVASLEQQIQSRMVRTGEMAVSIASTENDLEDTEESLAEDKTLLARLGTICSEKQGEFEENMRMRSLELKALSETIKMLSNDDALELLKKSLPSPDGSFLQLTESSLAQRSRALAVLRQSRSPSVRLDLLALALQGKKMGLQKVLKMIDGMISTLKNEQSDDEAKLEHCQKELDQTEDEKKDTKHKISDEEAVIAERKEELGTEEESIDAVKDGMTELDKAVADATEQRKEENAEYKELMATNAAAVQLLKKAKERLSEFYNSPAPASFAQVSARTLRLQALREAPQTAKQYSKSQASGGVLEALEMIITDLEKEMTVAKTQEEHAQEVYEGTMKESAKKRQADAKTLEEETSRKADLKASIGKHKHAEHEAEDDLQDVRKHIDVLHVDCDFMLKFFNTRKQARNDEIDGLFKARAVLVNADA